MLKRPLGIDANVNLHNIEGFRNGPSEAGGVGSLPTSDVGFPAEAFGEWPDVQVLGLFTAFSWVQSPSRHEGAPFTAILGPNAYSTLPRSAWSVRRPALAETLSMAQEEAEMRTAEELRAAPTLEQQYFQRGKELLGPKAGGLLVTLLRKKGGDLALARAVIEMAATKQDPREYVSRVAGPKNPGRLSVAQIDGLKAAAARQLAEREKLSKPHSEEEKAAVAAAHARFKRVMAECPAEPRDRQQREIAARQLGRNADNIVKLRGLNPEYPLEDQDALMRRAMDDFDREFGG